MTVVDVVTGKAPASISRRGRLLDLLANTAIFRGLAAGDLVRIAGGTRETRVERRQVLFRRGERVEGFHIVAVGLVKLSLVAPDGARQYRLCGEFLPAEGGGEAQWTSFATIKTSGYEQYVGGQSASFCAGPTMTWDEGDLSAALQSRLDALR